jgi:hypothetical protein
MELRQNGFSLVEVMMAGGLMGLIAMGSMHLMKGNKTIEKRGDLMEGANRSLLELSKLVHKSQKAMSWDEFDYGESYYENEGMPELVKWDISDVNWADTKSKLEIEVDGVNFYKSSNLISIPLLNGKSSVLFSRCVPKSEINTKFTVNQAYNLENIPILKRNNKILRASCCKRESEKSCSNLVTSEDSSMRLRTFYYRNGRLKNYPLIADKKFLKGTGFFITFDKEKSPNSYKLVLFNQTDSCYYKDRNCKSNYLLTPKTLSFSLKTQGIQDSGFIEMN